MDYRRLDGIITLDLTRVITSKDQTSVRLLGGITSLRSDASTAYPDISGHVLGKLVAEYTRIFPGIGDITLGMSFKLDETKFGGGNLRLNLHL